MKHLLTSILAIMLATGCSTESYELISTAAASLLAGSSGKASGGNSQGGNTNQGGTGQGGVSNGGTSTGGIATGGTSTGGTSGCWKDIADEPFPEPIRNEKALLGAQEGFDAAVVAHGCLAGEVGAMCEAGVVIWPGGLRNFCIRAAAWASARACFAAEAQACTPGLTIVVAAGNVCTAVDIPPMCVWARAWACAYAEAYAFAWACSGAI